jgi:EmrB/QacA subfamily drug resistance transporter
MDCENHPENAPRLAAAFSGSGAALVRGQDEGECVKMPEPGAGAPAVKARAAASLDPVTARAILAGIFLAMFLYALDQTIVAPALPAIGKSLGDVEDLAWVVSAYLLAATAATPLFGKLSDIYGRRAILLVGISIFMTGSVACALAPTLWVLVIARGFQGIGGGGLLPMAQTVVADLFTPRERSLVQGRISVVFMTASIIGPVLGGFLTEYLHWSFIFWINLPIGAAALLMSERALRLLPRNDRPHRLDMVGAGLLVSAAVALMLALAWGGKRYAWLSPAILSLLLGSVVISALFVLRLATAREPFIPIAILRNRITSTITIAAFFSIGTVIGVTVYTPLFCQTVLGVSAGLSGVVLIAYMAGATLGSLFSTQLIVRLRHYMNVPRFGLVVAVGMLALLAANPAAFTLVTLIPVLFVLGLGLGPMYPVSTIVMQNAVEAHQLGVATGAVNFFRSLGGAIVVAVFGAIVLGSPNAGLSGESLGRIVLDHGDLAPAFRWVFIAAAACLSISFCCLFAVEERPLHGPIRAAAE